MSNFDSSGPHLDEEWTYVAVDLPSAREEALVLPRMLRGERIFCRVDGVLYEKAHQQDAYRTAGAGSSNTGGLLNFMVNGFTSSSSSTLSEGSQASQDSDVSMINENEGALFFTNFQLIFSPYKASRSPLTILDAGCVRLPLCSVFQVTSQTACNDDPRFPTPVLQITGKNLLVLRFAFSTTFAFQQAMKWATVMSFPEVTDMFAFALRADEQELLAVGSHGNGALDTRETQTITSKGVIVSGVLGSPFKSPKGPRTFASTKTRWKLEGDADTSLEVAVRTLGDTGDLGDGLSEDDQDAFVPQIRVYEDWQGTMSPHLKRMMHLADDVDVEHITLNRFLRDVYNGIMPQEESSSSNGDARSADSQDDDHHSDNDDVVAEQDTESLGALVDDDDDGREKTAQNDTEGGEETEDEGMTTPRTVSTLKRVKSFVVTQPEQLQSLDYSCEIPGCKFDYAETSRERWYDARKEFDRQGVGASKLWRYTEANEEYQLCSTYPRVLVVPSAMSDKELMQVASFRTKSRLPVLTWRHMDYENVAMLRSSQPRVGVTNSRNVVDEALLDIVQKAQPSQDPLLIIDCRPKTNAVANSLAGGGYESSVYENCTVQFANIENIHVMRDSLSKLMDLCALVTPGQGQSTLTFGDSGWLSKVENTGWLEHVRLVLMVSLEVARAMEQDHISVLVHCSDGWDRTAQVCALAQIMLDPYYRTIEGFEVLIEKDWCSFGHKFAQRLGHGDSKYWDDQRSPVFLQFLDCVYQLLVQFPMAFEFNENLLIAVADHMYTCQFGTFLCNCEREREELEVRERCVSVWTCLNHYARQHDEVLLAEGGRMFLYTNPFFVGVGSSVQGYVPSTVVEANQGALLNVDCSSVSMRLWRSYYLRWHHSNVTYHGLVNVIPREPSAEPELLYRSLKVERDAMAQMLEEQREGAAAMREEMERLRKQLEKERVNKLEGIVRGEVQDEVDSKSMVGGDGECEGDGAEDCEEEEREDVGEYYAFDTPEEWEHYNRELLGMPLARFVSGTRHVDVEWDYPPLCRPIQEQVKLRDGVRNTHGTHVSQLPSKNAAAGGSNKNAKGTRKGLQFDFNAVAEPNQVEELVQSVVYGQEDSFYGSLMLAESSAE